MTFDQFKNLLAFLCLATNGHGEAIMGKSPDYLLEKFSFYGTLRGLRDDDAWAWGRLHPTLRRGVFDAYLAHWADALQEMFPHEERNTPQ